jgi:tryptophan 2,3-dioxygenase
MRHLDHTINITWVMQHLNVAIKYIDHSVLGDGEATEVVIGKYIQSTNENIFPELWTEEEIANWGNK